MKSLATLTLLAGSLFLMTGCESPGYTAHEDAQRVSRNWGYDLRQTTSDWNDLFIMDRPSHLTKWAVQ